MSSALSLEQRLRSITIEPAAASWPDLVNRHWNSKEETRAAFRRELGLPTDRPVIMSGHQAELWHPGILAKYFATASAADALGAGGAWLVVDQDTNAPGSIRYPAHGVNGALEARTWHALPEADRLAESNVPLCHIPAQPPAAPPPGPGAALEHVRAALASNARAPSVAAQISASMHVSLAGVLPELPQVFASRLSSTSLFSQLVERMRSDPLACVRAYNHAVRKHPAAGMKPLLEGDDPELPLWHLPGSTADPKPRRRATSRTLGTVPVASLAPRALFMTAILRLAGCDLFVHGLGGGAYDPVTEHWIRDWLGEELAPAAVVTATLTLPLEADVLPPEAIDWAAWRAHHASHNPVVLGDRAAAAKKAELLARIRAAKKAGQDPAPAFRELHELLDAVRRDHAAVLERLSAEAARVRARRPEATVLHDRTWPAPLFPHEDLLALRGAVADRFASSGDQA